MHRSFAFVLLLISSAACTPAGFAQMSAEPIACPVEQIEISDGHQPMEGPSSWTATCVGQDGGRQKWFCSKAHDEVICTEDPS